MDRRALIRVIISMLFPLFFSSCGKLLYLFKGAKYELLLLSKEQKITELLEDKKISPDVKRKLRLVLEVKKFAKEIGLKPGKNYDYYSDIEIKNAAYILTAVKSLSWDVKTWWFPIVGRVPYLGFPSLKDAQRYAEKLRKMGYDTDIGMATAFSTLGFLPDPVTPVMLERSEPLLCELILHELTHATLYFSGETQFDEHIAVYVENIGGILFAGKKWGQNSEEYLFLKNKWHDTLLFSSFLKEVRDGLNAIFSETLSSSEKLKKKNSFLDEKQRKLKKIKFKTSLFINFSLLPPNNARLLQYLIYYEKISSMSEKLHHSTELKKIIDFFNEKPSGITPWEWIDKWKDFHG